MGIEASSYLHDQPNAARGGGGGRRGSLGLAGAGDDVIVVDFRRAGASTGHAVSVVEVECDTSSKCAQCLKYR